MKILSNKRYEALMAQIESLKKDSEENLARSVTISNLTLDLEQERSKMKMMSLEIVEKDATIEELKRRLSRKNCARKKRPAKSEKA